MSPVITNLKVLLLNAENLFLLSDQKLTLDHLSLTEAAWQKLSTSIYDNKSLLKLRALAHIFKTENPDLILFCEVGGLESLKNFNHLFLNDAYSPALIEGNSDRHIDVGFLVRKEIGFYFDVISNKNRSLNFLYPHEIEYNRHHQNSESAKLYTSHKFSRDVAELHFFEKDPNKPFLITLLTHLKSRLDPQFVDPNGFERRRAELGSLVEIYQELETKYKGQVPILVAGDFNGQATKQEPEPEFAELYSKTNLIDVCDLASLSKEQRATYFQVSRSNRAEGRQIDYCFLSPRLQAHLKPGSVRVHRYQDHKGLPLDPPTSLDAKSLLPSDHYPLIFELEQIPVISPSS